jgi:hypothetical protein
VSSQPTIGGFLSFITNIMAVPAGVIDPANPPNTVTWAFDFALQFVNRHLTVVPSIPGAWTMYEIAVYNIAADTLINWAQDVGPPYVVYEDGLPYWQYLRKSMNVLAFVAGVVQSTSDEGTSASYLVPDAFKNYTIANLGQLKTPFGRAYLGIAQSWGTQWGLS